MEGTISKLLGRYESGTITRRELIQSLAVVAAVSGSASAAGFQGKGIDHVSILSANPRCSADFYKNALGFSVVRPEDKEGAIRLGTAGSDRTRIVARPGKTPGLMDHFAVGVDPFDKDSIIRELKARSIATSEEGDAGFHVKDPDGLVVQIVPSARL